MPKYALLHIGNGRDYLHTTVPAARHHINVPITHRLMVDDAVDPTWGAMLDVQYPDFAIAHTRGAGMAAAVQAGFDMVLLTDADYVIWVEDDMELTATLPLGWAATILERHHMIAQMCFRREPWWGSPAEMTAGDQLSAICTQADHFETRELYTVHNFLFSLNPCLIPRRTIERGWDVENEAGMTKKLDGHLFGSWGVPGDGQVWCRHLGEARGAGWQL